MWSFAQVGGGPQAMVPWNCELMTGSCRAAKLETWKGGNSRGSVHVQRAQQEVLWRKFFLDPSLWWDNRLDKKTSRSPDFRHKVSKEVIWLDNVFKPAWVELQLAKWSKQMEVTMTEALSSGPNLTSHYDPGSCKVAGFEMVEACSKLCDKGQLAEAVGALGLLVQTGSRVSTALFYSVLKVCLAQKNLTLGRRVHALAVTGGYQSNTFLANHILRMYASYGRLKEAMQVFDEVTVPDTFIWYSIISAHSESGQPTEAIKLYQQMRQSTLKPNTYIFVAAINACATLADLEVGMQVHAELLDSGVVVDMLLGNCMVNMYVKCGSLEDARRVFDSLPRRDVVTWNSMITGYSEHGLGQEALALYARMEQEGMIAADSITFACLLKACAVTGALQQGKQLHSQIQKRGLEADVVVGSSLVDMYSKCGRLETALKIFNYIPTRDVVTWTAMIMGYTEHGRGQEALALYSRMEQEGSVVANHVTFACLLKACASIGAIQQGKELHLQILDRGLDANIVVATCLVDMYLKCGKLEDARKVFDSFAVRDLVMWTAMIAGYVENDLGQEALALYAQMDQEGMIVADNVTFASLLKACTSVGALQQGKQIHAQILERGLAADLSVGNCLVDMYAKCGSLEVARRVFEDLPNRDVVTWTALLNGFGQCNKGKQAIQCFHEMLQAGVVPNEITFVCLLIACSHGGLVSEGVQYFNAMVEDHSIMPSMQHYMCMVDLLGRSGQLDEAEKMLLSIPDGSDLVGWKSLLNACRNHKDIDRGRRCFEYLTRLDPLNGAAYVLMANIYADAGMWTNVDRIESHRKLVGASKVAAKAGIEVNRQVHAFVVGEKRNSISSKVRTMKMRLQEGGHVPHTELVLKPVSEEEKEDELCGHAEKLALAYGLLNTPDGTPLLITKNLRMCGDCHSATQIMSKIEKREIIVRDVHRVHRFVEGLCCCGDRP